MLVSDVERHADEAVITLRGELDLSSGHVLRDAADEAMTARPARLVLDLSALTFCDSTGLSELIRLYQRTQQAGTELVLDRPTPRVDRILAATGLDTILSIQNRTP